MSPTIYHVQISPFARKVLSKFDKGAQRLLADAIDSLAIEPKKKGKPLHDELASYWSIRTKGQRYRVLYHIEDEIVTVTIMMMGIRREGDKKDVYALAKKLVKAGLLD